MIRLTTLYNVAKGSLSGGEALVNQLTEINKKSSQSITACDPRNAALSDRISAVKQVISNNSKGTRARRGNSNRKYKSV